MPDYRQMLISSIEKNIVNYLTREQSDVVTGKIIQLLNDYEITKRTTDIVVYDDVNERILRRYCACLMIDGKSEKTIEQYSRTIRNLLAFLQKNVTDIGVYDIRYYFACRKEQGLSNRSLENTRANLSAFFQWMSLEELIPKNPCLMIKPIKYKDEIRKAFSEIEIDQLRSACKNQRERAIVEFLLATGVRVSELVSMNVADVDFDRKTVHVRNGKGSKERITYISDVAMSHLKRYLESRTVASDVLFYGGRGSTRISDDGTQRMLRSLGTRAKVSNVHPHRFRRTFATTLANRGMKVQEIQKLLGHSSLATTMEYVVVDNNRIQASYKQYIA